MPYPRPNLDENKSLLVKKKKSVLKRTTTQGLTIFMF